MQAGLYDCNRFHNIRENNEFLNHNYDLYVEIDTMFKIMI